MMKLNWNFQWGWVQTEIIRWGAMDILWKIPLLKSSLKIAIKESA